VYMYDHQEQQARAAAKAEKDDAEPAASGAPAAAAASAAPAAAAGIQLTGICSGLQCVLACIVVDQLLSGCIRPCRRSPLLSVHSSSSSLSHLFLCGDCVDSFTVSVACTGEGGERVTAAHHTAEELKLLQMQRDHEEGEKAREVARAQRRAIADAKCGNVVPGSALYAHTHTHTHTHDRCALCDMDGWMHHLAIAVV
jgi:hypothetical protein